MTGDQAVKWERRQLARRDADSGPLDEVARSAVSADLAPLHSLFLLRHDLGRERVVCRLHGMGTGWGPWVDTVLDLDTGEVFELSSEQADWQARRVFAHNLPDRIRDRWPRDGDGRLISPELTDDGFEPISVERLRQVASRGPDAPVGSLWDAYVEV